MKLIEQLEHKARTEKQPCKKLDLFEKLKELKRDCNGVDDSHKRVCGSN